jgi:hypothetical protein
LGRKDKHKGGLMDPEDYLSDIDDKLEIRETGSWVCDKYYYIKRYIYIFETSMRNKWKNRTYIDLFSGPGKCRDRDTKKVYIGSPLIALTTEFPLGFPRYFGHLVKPERIAAARIRWAI